MLNRRELLTSTGAGLISLPFVSLTAETTPTLNRKLLNQASMNIGPLLPELYYSKLTADRVSAAAAAVTSVIDEFDRVGYDSYLKPACLKISPDDPALAPSHMAYRCWNVTRQWVPAITYQEVGRSFIPPVGYNPQTILHGLATTGLRPHLVTVQKALADLELLIPIKRNEGFPGDPGLCLIAAQSIFVIGEALAVVTFMCIFTVVLEILCVGLGVCGIILAAIRLVVAMLCGI